MGQWRFYFEDWQTHRVTTLVTDSPIISPDNMNGLYFPLSIVISFLPLPPISETEGDVSLTIEPLIPCFLAPLKLEDPSAKLTSIFLPLVTDKIEDPSYTPTKEIRHPQSH